MRYVKRIIDKKKHDLQAKSKNKLSNLLFRRDI